MEFSSRVAHSGLNRCNRSVGQLSNGDKWDTVQLSIPTLTKVDTKISNNKYSRQ